jgi:hypothetical protein
VGDITKRLMDDYMAAVKPATAPVREKRAAAG